MATTTAEGVYVLNNVTAGGYTIQVRMFSKIGSWCEEANWNLVWRWSKSKSGLLTIYKGKPEILDSIQKVSENYPQYSRRFRKTRDVRCLKRFWILSFFCHVNKKYNDPSQRFRKSHSSCLRNSTRVSVENKIAACLQNLRAFEKLIRIRCHGNGCHGIKRLKLC